MNGLHHLLVLLLCAAALPLAAALEPADKPYAVPNPFRLEAAKETKILVPIRGFVKARERVVGIYSSPGAFVRRLPAARDGGFFTALWDGRDYEEKPAPSGSISSRCTAAIRRLRPRVQPDARPLTGRGRGEEDAAAMRRTIVTITLLLGLLAPLAGYDGGRGFGILDMQVGARRQRWAAPSPPSPMTRPRCSGIRPGSPDRRGRAHCFL
jgi:hypothetical protein